MDEDLFPQTALGHWPAEEAIDPDAPHWKREHFIPLRKSDLVRLLAEDAQLPSDQREQFWELCRLLEAALHFECHRRLERLKSFLGYLRTKDKYQLNLTRSLYYQNLDSNAGVLFRVLDEAAEQEVREALLAYALLRRRGGAAGWNARELDRQAEAYLQEVLDFEVDFEVHDALAKLQRLGCVERTPGGNWRAVSMERAIAQLGEVWHGQFHPPSASAAPSPPH